MTLREERRQLYDNTKKDATQIYAKVKQYPLVSLFFIIMILLLVTLPYLQVNYQEVSNNTERATLENQYRATLAQILGGVAIGIGLYYTWRRITISEENLKVAQENLKVSQEGQITERFTRAVDQLGNPAIEIKLGGIYALERISNESEKDYWPIMEILTAYIRNNSSVTVVRNRKVANLALDIQANESITREVPEIGKISLDIQAVLTVLGRRKNFLSYLEPNHLNLRATYLRKADLKETHLERAELLEADLQGANLQRANLENAIIYWANLEEANLWDANFEGAHLIGVNFKNAILSRANLEETDLRDANLEKANLYRANLEGTDLRGANLERADLENAILYWANLEGANLEGTNLREAHFEGAYLAAAYLEGAYFHEANLEKADLRDSHLKRARYLTIDQLSKVKTLYNAELDEELYIPLKEKYPALFEEPDENEP